MRLDGAEGAAIDEDEPLDVSQREYFLAAQVFKGVIHTDGEGLQAGRSIGLLSGGRSMGVLSLVGQHRGFMEPIENDAEEPLRVDRLGDEIHHGGSQAARPVSVEGVGGHGDDAYVRPPGEVVDLPGRLDSVCRGVGLHEAPAQIGLLVLAQADPDILDLGPGGGRAGGSGGQAGADDDRPERRTRASLVCSGASPGSVSEGPAGCIGSL